MTTLNVVVDDMLSAVPGGASTYATEMTSALIDFAPAGCFVEGLVASSTQEQYDFIASRLPGLAGLFKSALVRRDLTRAWQHGFTPVPSGMVHAPTLYAPLRRHDRVNDRSSQIAVTIHDTVAWTHPEFLTSREVAWTKSMAARAVRYADAVVVPTHAVASELDELLGLGDRTRVIAGAVAESLAVPDDAEERAERLELPDRYLVSVGDSGPRQGIKDLLSALSILDDDLPLMIVGAEREPGSLQSAITESGVDSGRVRGLGALDSADYATVLAGATVFVHPTVANGFGTPMLEAFKLGVPVIHAATPSLLEVAGDAGVPISTSDPDAYAGLIAESIARLLGDADLRKTMAILGEDRSRVFSWAAAAEAIWQLHAGL